MRKERSDYIDLVKGIAIITLVFLHFEEGYIDTTYNFFLVRSPAFYMIVGWLWGLSSNKRTLHEHWVKRWKGLVIPYLWFSIIFISFDLILILCHMMDPFIIWRDIYKTICLRGVGTLWFLPSLLLGELLFIFVRDQSMFIRYVAFVVAFMLMFVCSYLIASNFLSTDVANAIFNAPLEFIKDSLMAFLFIFIAYFLSFKYGHRIVSLPTFYKLFIGMSGMLASFYISTLPINTLVEGSLRYVLASGIAGVSIIFIAMLVENWLIFKPIVYFGKNSLILMAVHFSILLPLIKLFDQHVLDYEVYSGARTIGYFFIIMVMQYLIIEFINRKAKFIIGK